MAIVQSDTDGDFRRLFTDLVDVAKATLDGGCDHSVGICECAARGTIYEAELALRNKRVCNCCWGDRLCDGCCENSGVAPGDMGRGSFPCGRCGGTGEIAFNVVHWSAGT